VLTNDRYARIAVNYRAGSRGVRRELIVGALPLLFGIHQLVEGFVWLGLRGEVAPGLGDTAKQTYIIFAHAILPALVPLGFTLLEPDRRDLRRGDRRPGAHLKPPPPAVVWGREPGRRDRRSDRASG
jgi:hypothetical protein